MRSILNRWVRQFHRWFAYPFIVLIILLLLMRQTQVGEILLRIQQFMVLIMALTGLYMLLLPYLTKWRRSSHNR
jgi:uncharacterized protein YybS (DUF2232 family)